MADGSYAGRAGDYVFLLSFSFFSAYDRDYLIGIIRLCHMFDADW